MGVPEVTEFLTHLAVEGHVSASTQNQALNAIVFLYKHVLEAPSARALMPCGPSDRDACPWFCRVTKCGGFWRRWMARINSWDECCMAAACG